MKPIITLTILSMLSVTPFVDYSCPIRITKEKLRRAIEKKGQRPAWTEQQIEAAAGSIFTVAHWLNLRDSLLIGWLSFESDLNPWAFNVNADGSFDRGIGQINSKTFQGEYDFYNPVISVNLAMIKIRDCAREFRGLNKIRCYNWGGGMDYVREVLRNEER